MRVHDCMRGIAVRNQYSYNRKISEAIVSRLLKQTTENCLARTSSDANPSCISDSPQSQSKLPDSDRFPKFPGEGLRARRACLGVDSVELARTREASHASVGPLHHELRTCRAIRGAGIKLAPIL
jgi:hypothetical protein